MSEVTENNIGYLSDVKPGDTLFYTRDYPENEISEVTVKSIELTSYKGASRVEWVNCEWEEADGMPMENGISPASLFRTEEEALKHLIKKERKYINHLDDMKAKAQVRIMDLEERITQLHV